MIQDLKSINATMKINMIETKLLQLDTYLEALKQCVLVSEGQLSMKVGSAQIVLKKNGDIQIKGNKVTITGSGTVVVKADGDLVLKGSSIKEN